MRRKRRMKGGNFLDDGINFLKSSRVLSTIAEPVSTFVGGYFGSPVIGNTVGKVVGNSLRNAGFGNRVELQIPKAIDLSKRRGILGRGMSGSVKMIRAKF